MYPAYARNLSTIEDVNDAIAREMRWSRRLTVIATTYLPWVLSAIPRAVVYVVTSLSFRRFADAWGQTADTCRIRTLKARRAELRILRALGRRE